MAINDQQVYEFLFLRVPAGSVGAPSKAGDAQVWLTLTMEQAREYVKSWNPDISEEIAQNLAVASLSTGLYLRFNLYDLRHWCEDILGEGYEDDSRDYYDDYPDDAEEDPPNRCKNG